MKPKLKCVEVEPAVADDHDLTIEHTPTRQLLLQWRGELGKVAIERSLIAALNQKLVSVAKHERAKAIPLRLVDPSVAGRQLVDTLRQHRKNWRTDRQVHAKFLKNGDPRDSTLTNATV